MDRQREWALSDWERLGRTFATGREDAGLTQVSAAQALGVTRTPIQAIERGRQSNGQPFSKVTQTMRGYAQLIGWTADSPVRILNGQGPEQATQPDSASEADAKSDLPPGIARELRTGKTLDHTVVHLSGEGDDDDVRLVVVLKGGENMSDEEIDRRYEQWRKARRHLQAIPGESDTPQEP
ncbi:helix-turn-helix transcriptional regulator [Streptomyces sp. NPDC001652]|uniref:helix-turn-helix domain-containing protein n=1 Tax=Streptomyces sp. NPDC001652 TaxID=3154393 RepID=UPI0033264823